MRREGRARNLSRRTKRRILKLAKAGGFEPPGLFVGLRLSRDRHLEHAIALVGEQIIGFLDLFEFEAMGD